MSTTVQKQVLINARALIADRARWTRCTFARTASGHQVVWYAETAAKWCAVGALYRAAYDLVGDPKAATRIGDELAKSVCPKRWLGSLATLNDWRGHAAVLKTLDKALQVA
jgi:hypothetical protein